MAVAIVGVSIFFTNILVRKIASDERQKIKTWAGAVQQRAQLISFNEAIFKKMQLEERKKVEALAIAYRKIADSPLEASDDYSIEIITQNNSIPVILTDENRIINSSRNISNLKDGTKLEGKLLKEFSVYPPIAVNYLKNRCCLLI
jgi:hypothetical protein